MLKKMTVFLLWIAAFIFTPNMFSLTSVTAQENSATVQEIHVDAQLVRGRLSPDQTMIAVYENEAINNREPLDRYLWLIDAATGEEITTLTEPTDYAGNVAFNADGSIMASLHSNGAIYLWDMSSYTLLKTFRLPFYSNPYFAEFMPDDHTLVFPANGNFGQILFLDTETGAITNILFPLFDTLQGLTDMMSDSLGRFAYVYVEADLAPDGTTLAVATANDAVFLWDVETAEQNMLQAEGERKGQFSITSLNYTPDGTLLAYGSFRDSTITIRDTQSNAETVLPIAADNFALTPDGSRIAWISREDNRLYFAPVDAIEQPAVLLQLPENLRAVPRLTSLNFSDDGAKLLLSGMLGDDDGGSSIYLMTLAG